MLETSKLLYTERKTLRHARHDRPREMAEGPGRKRGVYTLHSYINIQLTLARDRNFSQPSAVTEMAEGPETKDRDL